MPRAHRVPLDPRMFKQVVHPYPLLGVGREQTLDQRLRVLGHVFHVVVEAPLVAQHALGDGIVVGRAGRVKGVVTAEEYEEYDAE